MLLYLTKKKACLESLQVHSKGCRMCVGLTVVEVLTPWIFDIRTDTCGYDSDTK